MRYDAPLWRSLERLALEHRLSRVFWVSVLAFATVVVLLLLFLVVL